MMVATAQSDGGITERERAAITAEMSASASAPRPSRPRRCWPAARWLVQDRNDAGEVFRRLTPLVLRTCGPTERSDLIEMLGTIAVGRRQGRRGRARRISPGSHTA